MAFTNLLGQSYELTGAVDVQKASQNFFFSKKTMLIEELMGVKYLKIFE
jgi:hypothetical protein